MKAPRRTKLSVSAVIFLFVICVLASLAITDWARLQTLHENVPNLRLGHSAAKVVELIGHPDSIGNGTVLDEFGNEVPTTVWMYTTRFDWDGIRTRWNHQSLVPYWCSRVWPARTWSIDNVLTVHIADHAVVASSRADADDGLLFRTR